MKAPYRPSDFSLIVGLLTFAIVASVLWNAFVPLP